MPVPVPVPDGTATNPYAVTGSIAATQPPLELLLSLAPLLLSLELLLSLALASDELDASLVLSVAGIVAAVVSSLELAPLEIAPLELASVLLLAPLPSLVAGGSKSGHASSLGISATQPLISAAASHGEQ